MKIYKFSLRYQLKEDVKSIFSVRR